MAFLKGFSMKCEAGLEFHKGFGTGCLWGNQMGKGKGWCSWAFEWVFVPVYPFRFTRMKSAADMTGTTARKNVSNAYCLDMTHQKKIRNKIGTCITLWIWGCLQGRDDQKTCPSLPRLELDCSRVFITASRSKQPQSLSLLFITLKKQWIGTRWGAEQRGWTASFVTALLRSLAPLRFSEPRTNPLLFAW